MSKKTELFWDGLGADTLARKKKQTWQQKTTQLNHILHLDEENRIRSVNWGKIGRRQGASWLLSALQNKPNSG